MKKFLAPIFGLLLICSANAETYLKVESEKLEHVAEQHFPDESVREKLLAKYRDLLGDNGGSGLTADDMWTVCKAGGLKVRQSDGKQKCQAFVNDLAAITETFYQVCDVDKGKSGITARCIDTVFDARTGDGDVQVTTRDAINLAIAYAKHHYNDTIQCLDFARTKSNDDFIACKSTTNPNTYYEFRFSDAKEHKDVAHMYGVEAGICAVYGLDYIKAGSATSGSVSAGAVSAGISWPSACKTSDANLCDTQISKTAQDFAYSVSYDAQNGCTFKSNIIRDAKDIKNDYGNPPIDNWIFSEGVKNIELYATSDLDSTIENYVRAKIAPTSLNSFSCQKSHRRYIRSGTSSDDVLTCFVNGKQVDFVFDDLTQFRGFLGKKKIAGSQQAIECMTADGVYDGRNCATVSELGCEKIRTASAADCPDCKSVYWDAENQICVLGAAKNASNWNKGIKIGTVAGTAVIAVAATVFSGGTAAPGAWAIVAKVGSGLVIAGATGQVASESAITFGIFDPFVKKANLCIQNNDAKCAEDLVINELNRMQSYSKEFTPAEATALDEVFVQLINLIPDDSVFWDDFFGNPDFFDCSVPSDPTTCVVKESKQFWQIARTASNIAMIAGGVLKILSSVGTALQESRDLIRLRVETLGRHKNIGTLNQVNAWGTRGIAMPNQLIPNVAAQLGKPGITTNTALVKAMGWPIGHTIYWNPVTQTIVQGVAINMAGLIPITVGAGNMLYHNQDDADFFVVKGGYNTPTSGRTPTTPTNPTPVITNPVVTPTNPTTPVVSTPGTPEPDVTPTVPSNPDVTPNQPVVTPEPNRDITPFTVQDPRKTGLIATAAVLSAVGTGFLVGGLISKAQDDDNAKTSSGNINPLEQDLNKLLENANGALGFVDGSMIRLVRLSTATGAYAPILNIDGRAVVVVDYRGHSLPFYVNANTGSWAPLLGIGETGGWFNVYPTSGKTEIVYIDTLVSMLNQQLTPGLVTQFVKGNVLGVAFPMPGADAYKIINSEFPNGVIQKYDGTFTPAQQTLYNNNYNKMKTLF